MWNVMGSHNYQSFAHNSGNKLEEVFEGLF